ncbi:hypothetical protein Tco_0097654 [Tanacetum coccineum]
MLLSFQYKQEQAQYKVLSLVITGAYSTYTLYFFRNKFQKEKLPADICNECYSTEEVLQEDWDGHSPGTVWKSNPLVLTKRSLNVSIVTTLVIIAREIGAMPREEDFVDKPLYSRFSKTDNFKGVPHPLTGDYTPQPQQEIDDSFLSHLIKNYDFYEKKMAKEVELMKKHRSFLILPRPVQLIAVRQNVNSVRPNVNTGRANVNSVRQNVNSVRSNVNTDHPLKNMEDIGIFDSGCSGHMTGNKDHLDDFKECKGGFVTFGGSKGYITGKGKIRVGNLDFDSVSFRKNLALLISFLNYHKSVISSTSFDMKHLPSSSQKIMLVLIAKSTSDDSKIVAHEFPFVYEQEPCYNQNFNDNYFPQNSQSSSQQYLCCANCGGPHDTFQCQPMNEDYCEQNSCYDPNSFGFDQYQPPQFPVNYPPQETSREILQAQEDLMEAIQAFLKEYDHIPPNEKCMALLLAEERFLKIKQAMEEEQNQPEVLQELLLKLINDLQILKGIQQEKKKPTAQSSIPYWNSSMIDDEEARDNFLKDVYTFLKKFSRIPFGVTPKVILIAWESFGKIKDALTDKQYRQEDIQELMSKLLEDVQNISEEFSEYISYPSWNRPLFYFDNDDDEYTVIWRRPKAITPDEPIEEPDNSLSMGDEHLDTIPATESDEVIKSSVKILVPIPSELEVISDDTCDVPVRDDSSTFNDTSSDDDDFEDVEYVSFEEKLLNVHRLITNIESLKNNPTPDFVFKSPSSFPIPAVDSDSIFEESDTSFSHSGNSLLEFESFSDHTEETRIGSTTTHANYSLPEYDSFLFEIEPDQGGLTSIAMNNNSKNDPLLEAVNSNDSLPEFESFHFDPSFPHPPPEPPGVEICLNFKPDSAMINNFDVLNNDEPFDPGEGENVVFLNVEEDDSFTFTIRTFLPFVTYPKASPLSCSTGSEDTIFDPGIFT